MSEKDSPGSGEQTVREILQYLIERPDEKDTSEGISKWWRPEGKPEWRKDEIENALNELVSKKWLIVRDTSPDRKVYGFNKKCIREIREYLLMSRT